ncbi:MAG TPA: hypothetical protein VFR39_00560, partial [Burkholderiales bacterium]|nr:hypothetical protein [Burkholderiales bacterium]
IHFKVRMIAGPALGSEMTSQLYFDEAVTDRVLARAPYSVRGQRTRNSEDGLFRRNGNRLMLALAENGGGYTGDYHIGIKL